MLGLTNKLGRACSIARFNSASSSSKGLYSFHRKNNILALRYDQPLLSIRSISLLNNINIGKRSNEFIVHNLRSTQVIKSNYLKGTLSELSNDRFEITVSKNRLFSSNANEKTADKAFLEAFVSLFEILCASGILLSISTLW